MSRALQLQRSLPRYAAARVLAAALPAAAAAVGPLRLVDVPDLDAPAPGWGRVRPRLAGICGSDLAAVTGRAPFYLSPLVSFPFTPGHEVVGDLADDVDDLPAGTRVVLEPVLGCAARGVPECPGCSAGERGRCDRVTVGHLAPGLQTGYCADVGGGWSRELVAHRSQLHPVPDGLPDERAVLVEPLACAVHAGRRAAVAPGDTVLVVGAGTVGLLALVALRALGPPGRVVVVAKHPHQVRLARELGADEVLAPDDVVTGVRRGAGALRCEPEYGAPYLLGGVDVAVDAAGTAASLDTALRVTRAGGRVVLAGMPHGGGAAPGGPDLTPLWWRELELVGAYATGAGDFATALDIAVDTPLERLVTPPYALPQWREALDTALSAGRLGAVKAVFDPRRG